VDGARAWVEQHLGDLAGDAIAPSPRFRGGQRAADRALAAFSVAGYAARRSEVWPNERRGASGLSPWIRHGLLSLPRVWKAVACGPARDVARFRDELLWQEYARHLYARLGAGLGAPLRATPPSGDPAWALDARREPWDASLACVGLVRDELERDGWIPNQTRMWLASQWSVRAGEPWRCGENHFFRHLLDGSRAANRAGWQWAIGTATARPYGFSRWQVEKRAPGLCGGCALRQACPIERWPDAPTPKRVDEPALLRRDPHLDATAGPTAPVLRGESDVVWLTAESLGDADPALAAHSSLPALFVFDAPLLTRLRLSGKRLVFLAESLGDLATRRHLRVWRGDPLRVLAAQRPAATFAPVPGWRRIAASLEIAALHPWPWLARPHAGSLASYSQWRRVLGV
jgi:deoxyribodipyrimidine photo-lyase